MTRSRTRSRVLPVALLCTVPLLAGACSQGPNVPLGPQAYTASAAPGHIGAVVTLLYSSFEPSVVTIQQGESVEWYWKDNPNPHDVLITDYVTAGGTQETVESPIMQTGKWYEVFDVPGTYHYVCTIHSDMSGTIVVTAASGTTGAGPGGTGVTGGDTTGTAGPTG